MSNLVSGAVILASGPSSVVATSPGLPGPAGTGVALAGAVAMYADLLMA